MGTISRWLLVTFALVLAVGLGFALWRQLSTASVLKVAVGPAETEDAQLMSVFARTLSANKLGVRLNVELTSGPVESVAKLARGAVQLAVVRADSAPSDRIRAVAVLHTDSVVVVAPDQSKMEDLGALKDKALGVIGPPSANDALVATLQRHYGLTGPVKPIPPNQAAIVSAVKDRKVQALLFVAPAGRSADVGKAWLAVRNATHRKLAIVPIESASAIAAASDAYDADEISAGQFGGSPSLPPEDTSTLQVATYLIADRKVPTTVITFLTRALFEERQKMIPDAPTAALVKAASTDKDARFPVHPGAKAYYDGEETSFIDRYGDLLSYLPILFGALGSLVVGLRRFLFAADEPEIPLSVQVTALLSAIKDAEKLSDLDPIRADIDALVMRMTDASEQDNAAVATLAVGYLNNALADRREALKSA